MLQIDIEHAEYRNILAVSSETLRRFRIICMEIHGLNILHSDRTFFEYAFLPMLEKLNENHYSAHLTSNNACGSWPIDESNSFPNLIEVTFHRKDRAKQGIDIRSATPHPQDVMNAAHRPPLHINTHQKVEDQHDNISLVEEISRLKQDLRDLKFQFRQMASQCQYELSQQHKDAYSFLQKNDIYI